MRGGYDNKLPRSTTIPQGFGLRAKAAHENSFEARHVRTRAVATLHSVSQHRQFIWPLLLSLLALAIYLCIG